MTWRLCLRRSAATRASFARVRFTRARARSRSRANERTARSVTSKLTQTAKQNPQYLHFSQAAQFANWNANSIITESIFSKSWLQRNYACNRIKNKSCYFNSTSLIPYICLFTKHKYKYFAWYDICAAFKLCLRFRLHNFYVLINLIHFTFANIINLFRNPFFELRGIFLIHTHILSLFLAFAQSEIRRTNIRCGFSWNWNIFRA